MRNHETLFVLLCRSSGDQVNDDGVAMPVVVLDLGIKNRPDITTNNSFQGECCTTAMLRVYYMPEECTSVCKLCLNNRYLIPLMNGLGSVCAFMFPAILLFLVLLSRFSSQDTALLKKKLSCVVEFT